MGWNIFFLRFYLKNPPILQYAYLTLSALPYLTLGLCCLAVLAGQDLGKVPYLTLA